MCRLVNFVLLKRLVFKSCIELLKLLCGVVIFLVSKSVCFMLVLF